MQWSVVKPTITMVLHFSLSNTSFKFVPMKALLTFLIITISLSTNSFYHNTDTGLRL